MYNNNRWLLHRSNSMCYIWNSLAIMAKKESFSATRSPTKCMDVQSMISAANRCIVNSLVNFKFGKILVVENILHCQAFLSGLIIPLIGIYHVKYLLIMNGDFHGIGIFVGCMRLPVDVIDEYLNAFMISLLILMILQKELLFLFL